MTKTVHRNAYGLDRPKFYYPGDQKDCGWNTVIFGLGWGQGIPDYADYFVGPDNVVMRGSRWRMCAAFPAQYHYPLEIFQRIWRQVFKRFLEMKDSTKPVSLLKLRDPKCLSWKLSEWPLLEMRITGYSVAHMFCDMIFDRFKLKNSRIDVFAESAPSGPGSERHFIDAAQSILKPDIESIIGRYAIFYVLQGKLYGVIVDNVPHKRRKALLAAITQLNATKELNTNDRDRYADRQFKNRGHKSEIKRKYSEISKEINCLTPE